MMLDKRLLGLTRGSRGWMALCVLLGVSVSGASVWQGFLTADVIGRIFEGAPIAAIWSSLALILMAVILRAALLWSRQFAEKTAAGAIRQRLRQTLYRHLIRLGPGYLTQARSGTAQSTMVDGVEALEGYFGSYVPQVLVTLLAPTVILIWLFTLDAAVGLLILAAILAALFGPKLWEKALGKYGASHWGAYEELNAQFMDSMQGMATLKAFNGERRRGADLRERSRHLYKRTMVQLSVSMLSAGVVSLAMRIGSAAALGLGAYRLAQGELSAEALLLILFLASECTRPLSDLDAAWHQGYMGVSAASGVFSLLDAQPLTASSSKTASAASVSRQPAVAFEGVRFAYEPDRPALDGLSFRIEPGHTVALVGRSGSGKSTAVSLLLRFFDAQEGRIAIDGVDIRDMSIDTLRTAMAVVSQDTYLFYGTVAENLRLGAPDATQAELEAAARAANAHDFIQRLPHGYETLVGERGQTLSGGERQRMAIARALLKNAPILILDEATASVDAANEEDIQQALARLTRERTTLVIAHRLSAVADADTIVVLETGRMVESGRHGRLLERQGAYARLVAAQGEVA